jgi:protein-disulfide isomerase
LSQVFLEESIDKINLLCFDLRSSDIPKDPSGHKYAEVTELKFNDVLNPYTAEARFFKNVKAIKKIKTNTLRKREKRMIYQLK